MQRLGRCSALGVTTAAIAQTPERRAPPSADRPGRTGGPLKRRPFPAGPLEADLRPRVALVQGLQLLGRGLELLAAGLGQDHEDLHVEVPALALLALRPQPAEAEAPAALRAGRDLQ